MCCECYRRLPKQSLVLNGSACCKNVIRLQIERAFLCIYHHIFVAVSHNFLISNFNFKTTTTTERQLPSAGKQKRISDLIL